MLETFSYGDILISQNYKNIKIEGEISIFRQNLGIRLLLNVFIFNYQFHGID